jgi:alpha-glucuronidase
VLNHWENLDGSIEGGYAGKSLWNLNDLPGKVDLRPSDYGRANASLGTNGIAAGASGHLGAPKQLLNYHERSLLRHAVEVALHGYK